MSRVHPYAHPVSVRDELIILTQPRQRFSRGCLSVRHVRGDVGGLSTPGFEKMLFLLGYLFSETTSSSGHVSTSPYSKFHSSLLVDNSTTRRGEAPQMIAPSPLNPLESSHRLILLVRKRIFSSQLNISSNGRYVGPDVTCPSTPSPMKSPTEPAAPKPRNRNVAEGVSKSSTWPGTYSDQSYSVLGEVPFSLLTSRARVVGSTYNCNVKSK